MDNELSLNNIILYMSCSKGMVRFDISRGILFHSLSLIWEANFPQAISKQYWRLSDVLKRVRLYQIHGCVSFFLILVILVVPFDGIFIFQYFIRIYIWEFRVNWHSVMDFNYLNFKEFNINEGLYLICTVNRFA